MPSSPRPRTSAADDSPEAGARRDVSDDGPSHRVGLVADPGTPWELVRRIAPDLEARLGERLGPGIGWEVETHRAVLPVDDESGQILEGPAREIADERGWDTVIAVVDLPRFDDGRGVVADLLPRSRTAIVCVPALGVAAPRRRLRETIVRVLEHLEQWPVEDPPDGELDVRHADEEGVEPTDPAEDEDRPSLEGLEELTPLRDTAVTRGPAPSDASRDRESSTVYVKGWPGTLRLLAGMVMANRPLTLPRNMTWSVASASAAGAYGVFFGSIWALSNSMSAPRLFLVMLLALALLAGWLIVTNGLWAWDRERPQRSALDNLSTVLTVGIACSVVYALLFVTLAVVAGAIIPPAYLGQELGGPAGLGDFAQLVWLATSMGTMAGAVGSSFDDAERIRDATYSLRDQHRRRLGRDHRRERERREQGEGTSRE